MSRRFAAFYFFLPVVYAFAARRACGALPLVFVRAIYLEAEEDGVWYCNVKPKETVKKGQLLGRTEDFYGNMLHEYNADADVLKSGVPASPGRGMAAIHTLLNNVEENVKVATLSL